MFWLTKNLLSFKHLNTTGKIHLKIDVRVFFEKSVPKFQVLLKSDNNDYFTWRPIHVFLSYFVQFLLEWEIYSDEYCRGNQNTHFLFSNIYYIYIYIFFFGNQAFNEIMCKNTVHPGRPQMTEWRTRIAWWIVARTRPKADSHIACRVHAMPCR